MEMTPPGGLGPHRGQGSVCVSVPVLPQLWPRRHRQLSVPRLPHLCSGADNGAASSGEVVGTKGEQTGPQGLTPRVLPSTAGAGGAEKGVMFSGTPSKAEQHREGCSVRQAERLMGGTR